jgi:hypothetical protein
MHSGVLRRTTPTENSQDATCVWDVRQSPTPELLLDTSEEARRNLLSFVAEAARNLVGLRLRRPNFVRMPSRRRSKASACGPIISCACWFSARVFNSSASGRKLAKESQTSDGIFESITAGGLAGYEMA